MANPVLPHISDDIAVANGLAFFDIAPTHVQVLGGVGAVVPDLDVFAVALGITGFGHNTVTHGDNGVCRVPRHNRCPSAP